MRLIRQLFNNLLTFWNHGKEKKVLFGGVMQSPILPIDNTFYRSFRSIWKITEKVERKKRFEFIHYTGARSQSSILSPISHHEGDGGKAIILPSMTFLQPSMFSLYILSKLLTIWNSNDSNCVLLFALI